MTLRALSPVPQSAEQRLRQAFAREDALLAELREVRAEQVAARDDYADEQKDGRLLIRPSVQALRMLLR